ncbi:MAG: cardiolipin synthase [Arachnia sp.]
MDVTTWGTVILIVDYTIKIMAVGLIPENRHPSSSIAWLLIVLLLPVVGLPLFLIIGSPFVSGRRHRIQQQINQATKEGLAEFPTTPQQVTADAQLRSMMELNRQLTGMPAVVGHNLGVVSGYEAAIAAMAQAVDEAQSYVHVQSYIMAWDDTTEIFFEALRRAKDRGVAVRVLFDHIGSRPYPGYGALKRKLTECGFEWRLMMPMLPLKRRVRRPDLRNHRKMLVVDGATAFMGSQNMIDSSYLKRKHVRVGRHWNDCMVKVSGPIVAELAAVFASDWYAESGERLDIALPPYDLDAEVGGPANLFQLVPSGPGYSTDPNLRLFTSLMYRATRKLTLVSPYFVPDESMLHAVTTAAYRGVEVELFVSEQADQFVVDHAQSSYYAALLEAGLRIFRLPRPDVLHSKFFVVDDDVAVFGSSNLDMRSFQLDYEITLLGTGGDFVAQCRQVADDYRDRCTELTREQWESRPIRRRYVDNVMRLTSALM